MSIVRIARHLCTTHWRARRAFPHKALQAVHHAIAEAEATHTGRIHFVVEAALDGMPLLKEQSARERAIDVFSNLRLWDTEDNSGVLIYVLLADRQVEIVADRGIHAAAGSSSWAAVCRHMAAAFAGGRFESGAVEGVREVARHLAHHYPGGGIHVVRSDRPLHPVDLQLTDRTFGS